MRIGILTQPLHYNYGGIMQTWALQQVLKEMGHEPIKIDWFGSQDTITVKRFFILLLSWFKTLGAKAIGRKKYVGLASPYKHIFRHDQIRCVDRKFNKLIKSTRRIYSKDELKRIVEELNLDAFIVGSDQVWRQVYCPDIEIFFLGFLSDSDKRTRISYAASFGTSDTDIDDNKRIECIHLLHLFKSVSVRENSGVNIVRNIFGRNDVVQTLDPTLLIGTDEYRRLVGHNTSKEDNPFIAAYILDPNDEKNTILNDLSATLGHKTRIMTCNPDNGLDMPPVSQWIKNLADSDFVVTDSFHGCVFAIIFKKSFIAIGNEWRGLDRFKSLLELFELYNRLITNIDDYRIRKVELLSSINYDNVYRKLEGLRKNSLNYLKDALA